MKYADKLRDPRWQRKRLEIMQRDEFTCQECLSKDKTLNVHHRWYQRGEVAPWDYPDAALVTLCEECHKDVTKIVDAARRALGTLPVNEAYNALTFIVELQVDDQTPCPVCVMRGCRGLGADGCPTFVLAEAGSDLARSYLRAVTLGRLASSLSASLNGRPPWVEDATWTRRLLGALAEVGPRVPDLSFEMG